MKVDFVRDPVNHDYWLTAPVSEKSQLGAYMPGRGDVDVTVYWRGDLEIAKLQQVINRAEKAFLEKGGKVQGTLFAYGNKQASAGPTSDGLSGYLAPSSPLHGFAAYRAELEGDLGRMIIWANVADHSAREVKDGGENIGLCVRRSLFDGFARPVIASAILETMTASPDTIYGLLNEISDAMRAATRAGAA
jgi:hypothetical protein